MVVTSKQTGSFKGSDVNESECEVYFKKIGREVIDLIHLIQDKGKWRAVLNVALKRLFH
jgi:hypothetical protein